MPRTIKCGNCGTEIQNGYGTLLIVETIPQKRANRIVNVYLCQDCEEPCRNFFLALTREPPPRIGLS